MAVKIRSLTLLENLCFYPETNWMNRLSFFNVLYSSKLFIAPLGRGCCTFARPILSVFLGSKLIYAHNSQIKHICIYILYILYFNCIF